ncbi:MAG: hypothetical protein IJR14_02520 [Synergistaceae bacterium]|nr:hypothetical protein [Synergistaceae bacterium]
MRLFIATSSLCSVIAFGYALAGYGSSLVGGEVRMAHVVWGLLAGLALAVLALWLWARHKDEFVIPDGEGQTEDGPTAGAS